jgi:hypothetical protein
MPGLAEYPLNDPDQLTKLASDELATRRKAIDSAWSYYEGNHHKPLKVKAGQPDDNVILNVSRKAIAQAISLLFGELPTFEIQDDGQGEQQQRLDDLWTANDAQILLHNMALQGGLGGHVFLKLVPSETIGVRLLLLNPRQVSVFWQPDDMQVVTAYVIGYQLSDTEFRQDIVRMDQAWLVRDLVRERGRAWQIKQELTWGFPWAPVIDWQNLPDPEEYYGDPDLVRPELNDALNFVASNTMRIIKYHAHPKTIGTGMKSTDVQPTAVDGFWSVPNPDAKIANLEMQSDLTSSMAFLQLLQQWFFSEHRAVDMASFAADLGNLTNFGLRTVYKDALDKLATKRALYGKALADISERSLMLMGIGARPTITWPDPLPFNDQEEIAGIQTEIGLGILSKETAASLRGRDWELEQERIAEETAAADNIGSRLLAAFERGQ